jgi:hypothetical protein
MKKADVRVECLVAMRLAGRGPVRRALESLVNRGVVEVSEAADVWKAAFGGRLVAVTARTVEASL